MIGWSCSESREMISIEVEADNALPFYLLVCLPTANAYNRSRTRRAARDQLARRRPLRLCPRDVMGKV